MICNNAASKKSHTIRHPFKDPVINWKALCGFRIAEVSKSEDASLPTGRAAKSVETTCPVATQYILMEEPTREKKYLRSEILVEIK
jgi:hypothetical protein